MLTVGYLERRRSPTRPAAVEPTDGWPRANLRTVAIGDVVRVFGHTTNGLRNGTYHTGTVQAISSRPDDLFTTVYRIELVGPRGGRKSVWCVAHACCSRRPSEES